MHTASQALAIERQASAQPSLAERVSRPKTRAILGLMRLNFLSVAALLSAEMLARTGRDPALHYENLADEFGSPVARRLEAAATAQQKQRLAALAPEQIIASELAGERIDSILSHAPGNGEPIGGIKINTANGWFTVRPSGTEAIYKIYAESFINPAHLQAILSEAQAIVDATLSKEYP
ncbi:hypothetical protein J8G26_18855 [Acidovorax sp. JG5]|nr:hypothetical protein [Acidovorax sp. JG5]